MATYAKYEFVNLPKGILNLKNADVVVCPPFVITPGEYDAEGNVITEPVYSDKIHVDIYWHNKPDQTDPKRVYPKTPQHFIAGREQEYYNTL